ncbi:MAG: bifunctional nuclease family protein [Chlorobium phaeobacteroides]|uniref:BFN domain-containing protein n=1 Tax=Chlorobium phaeobacteroides (strain BS1) TaxID=331678 RepID=B3ELR6_CHLPB|nr:bifunctional nuclease family protein [Chlorobium phaeobacteroides]MBL6955581.1 bifunctional nuclease family protein [Chlorobium phaeobacteroides]
MEKLRVDILGLSTSPHTNGAYALILYEVEGKRKLPIIIGGFEAQAIALKLENIKPPRPFTHDLFKTVADTFNLSVQEVFIDELHNETFYAKVICEMQGEIHEIDARPSDAIAIAVRFGAPIFVSEDILNEAGILEEQQEDNTVEAQEKAGEEVSSEIIGSATSSLNDLQKMLEDAVNREDYEEAARLRDKISRFKESS